MSKGAKKHLVCILFFFNKEITTTKKGKKGFVLFKVVGDEGVPTRSGKLIVNGVEMNF